MNDLPAPAPGLDALLGLLRERVLPLQDSDAPGAAHSRDCDYEWMVSAQEWGLRCEGLLLPLRDYPGQAYADAADLRDDVLALGFVEVHRCEVTAARVEDLDDHSTVGWRGRIDLGLRAAGDGGR